MPHDPKLVAALAEALLDPKELVDAQAPHYRQYLAQREIPRAEALLEVLDAWAESRGLVAPKDRAPPEREHHGDKATAAIVLEEFAGFPVRNVRYIPGSDRWVGEHQDPRNPLEYQSVSVPDQMVRDRVAAMVEPPASRD